MFLPLQLTWNLMKPRSQKFGVKVLFGTGFVCILFATIRVLQIGSKTDGGITQPDPAWLMLWTMLEYSVAIIIACCPAFAALGMYRTSKDVQLRRSHDPRGYLKQESNGLDELRSDVKLQMLVTAEHGSRHNVDWPEDRRETSEWPPPFSAPTPDQAQRTRRENGNLVRKALRYPSQCRNQTTDFNSAKE